MFEFFASSSEARHKSSLACHKCYFSTSTTFLSSTSTLSPPSSSHLFSSIPDDEASFVGTPSLVTFDIAECCPFLTDHPVTVPTHQTTQVLLVDVGVLIRSLRGEARPVLILFSPQRGE